MKTLIVIIFTGMAFVAGNAAFAGRDESQMMQLRSAIAAKQAEQLAQQRQTQQVFAGAKGMQGKIGPAGQPTVPSRAPAVHP